MSASLAPERAARAPAAEKRRSSNLLAAFCSSTLYTVSTYPFHRVKVLIQTQDANPAVISGQTRRFHFASAFGRLLREHGGRPIGLWHGCTPYLLRHIPSVSISFAAKDAFRTALLPLAGGRGGGGSGSGDGRQRQRQQQQQQQQRIARLLAVNAAAGGLAGSLALALVYPFEFLTIRMSADVGGSNGTVAASSLAPAAAASQVRRRPPPPTTTAPWQFGRSPLEAARAVVARDGVLGLYRGFGPAVASAACYKALYFGLHDSAKAFAFGGRYAATGSGSAGDRDSGVHLGSTALSRPPPLFGAVAAADPDTPADDDHPLPPPIPLWRAALERLCIASGTTATAAALTHPLDVVRKRLVVDSTGELYGGTFTGAVRGIWAREGTRGFLRFLPQDVFLRMGAGTILVTYDVLGGGGGARGVF